MVDLVVNMFPVKLDYSTGLLLHYDVSFERAGRPRKPPLAGTSQVILKSVQLTLRALLNTYISAAPTCSQQSRNHTQHDVC